MSDPTSSTSNDAVVGATAEWPTDPSCYELVSKIGHGAFATVWKALARLPEPGDPHLTSDGVESPSPHECAVKVLNLDHVDTNLAEIRLEVQAMRLLSHPNVLTCHTAFVNDRNLWLVTPLMTKGSSLQALQAARRVLRKQQREACVGVVEPTTVNMEQHILFIIYETLLGLQYIHENGQIHRDIKAGNILLDGNGAVRIADFGVSGFLVHAGSQQEKAKTFVGTPCWMAPELMEQVHGYDYKADVWSLGITALELAKGYAPYARFPPMKVLILTIQEDPPSLASYDEDEDEVTDEYSKQFSAFVDLCLQKNPAKRPTCPELLKSKHFSAFQDASYRQERRDSIRNEICSIIKDVGYKQEEATKTFYHPRYNAPISAVMSTAEDRQKGTTWVFQDGSQILSSEAMPAEVDDVMAELDAFSKETGGEHHDRNSSTASTPQGTTNTQLDDSHNAEDDLDDFLNEFEATTQGEHFRRDNPI